MPSFGPIAFGPIGHAVPTGGTGIGLANNVGCSGPARRMMRYGEFRTKRKVVVRSTVNAAMKFAWVDHLDSVCGTLQVDSEGESTQQFREAGEVRLRAYAPSGTDIIETDRVVPLRGVYTDREFEVTSPQADDAGLAGYGKWRLLWRAGGGTR